MNILASAYACDPYDGSERAVGWNWICEIDNFHQVTALVSSVYKCNIEDYKRNNPDSLKNTEFVYIAVPKPLSFWHRGYRGERIYYIMWQICAANVAKKLVLKQKFDLVHHITYVTCVLPTYMHKLGLPFLYGPVAGGDQIPKVIGYPIGFKTAIFEKVRKFSQIIFTSTPNFKRTVKFASMILTATEETSRLIPKKYHNKIKIFQAIGLSDQFLYPEPQFKQNKKCRFLMVGRMLKLKGFEIGIDAFVSALNTGINAELVILGDGNSEHLRTLKKKSETVHEAIKFTEQVEYKKMRQFYQEFDVLLNCSMRDSGGFVVIEAMGCGLPVICIDTAGPKVNTTIDSAIKIKPANYSVMKKNLKEAIINMANNPELRETMGRAAYNRAINKFAASNRTKIMNEFYNQIITK